MRHGLASRSSIVTQDASRCITNCILRGPTSGRGREVVTLRVEVHGSEVASRRLTDLLNARVPIVTVRVEEQLKVGGGLDG